MKYGAEFIQQIFRRKEKPLIDQTRPILLSCACGDHVIMPSPQPVSDTLRLNIDTIQKLQNALGESKKQVTVQVKLGFPKFSLLQQFLNRQHIDLIRHFRSDMYRAIALDTWLKQAPAKTDRDFEYDTYDYGKQTAKIEQATALLQHINPNIDSRNGRPLVDVNWLMDMFKPSNLWCPIPPQYNGPVHSHMHAQDSQEMRIEFDFKAEVNWITQDDSLRIIPDHEYFPLEITLTPSKDSSAGISYAQNVTSYISACAQV